jgi:acyl dehydratase
VSTSSTRPPGLAPLYVRALLGARAHRSDTLPTGQYSVEGHTIDAGALARYQRICGFRVSDTVPATYPHVLAFPLTMHVMVQRDFPFPAPGLVHVANSISQHRPLRLGESITLRVRVAGLRPHSAGREFDVLTDAGVGDEAVWSSRSTYLHRERSAERAPRQPAQAHAPSGATAIWRMPADIGRRYAMISADRNPIHLSALTARPFGFRRPIAHGMWVAARVLATLEGRLPQAFSYDVTFKTPILLPATVSLTTSRDDPGWTLDLRDARTGKPHLTGTVA